MASARQEHTTIVSRTDEEAPRSGLRDAVRAIEGLVAIAKSRLRDRVTEAGAPLRAGPGKVGKGGVVRDPAVHEEVCATIRDWWAGLPSWRVLGIEPSPITGPEGNREFLIAALHG